MYLSADRLAEAATEKMHEYVRKEAWGYATEKEEIASFAAHQATMVVFLSTGLLEELSRELIAGGYTADTPAAIVYKATWPEEKTFVCTVGTLAETAKKNQITKTALMIIGNAVSQGNYRRSDLYNPTFTTEFREAEK